MVGKNQSARSNSSNSNNNNRMPVMLNIANPTPKNNSMTMLGNKSTHDIMRARNQRQLPMNLLEQSLTRSDAMMMQRNNNYHPSMPPPRANNRRPSLEDQLSQNDFRW
jgi:hypothetical protein